MIVKKNFGQSPAGETIHLYRITNSNGEYIELLDYGASMQSIVVRDRQGNPGDVLLGTDDEEKISTCLFIGSTIGRCANRVADGRFEIGGHVYQLEVDERGNCLHSGKANYARRMFQAEMSGENTVIFSLYDDGRGGFECPAEIQVAYTFDDDSRITMCYEMRAEGDTVFNPTNHAYFNLAGDGLDARAQILTVMAESKASCDEKKIPGGKMEPVEGTASDFRRPALIKANMGTAGSYDEYYIRDRQGYDLAAELISPDCGRRMRVYTDLPCIVFCMFPIRRPIPGKRGAVYSGYPFVCIEPQYVPNAVNCPEYASPVFRGGQVFRARTVYSFDTV